jgi:hypothetical protein
MDPALRLLALLRRRGLLVNLDFGLLANPVFVLDLPVSLNQRSVRTINFINRENPISVLYST